MPSEPTDCPSCEGSGETPVQDQWSQSREEHYTTGGDKCPCCKGEAQFEDAETAAQHHSGDDCWADPREDLPDREPEEPEPRGGEG